MQKQLRWPIVIFFMSVLSVGSFNPSAYTLMSATSRESGPNISLQSNNGQRTAFDSLASAPDASSPTKATIVYRDGTPSSTPRERTWNGTTWTSESTLDDAGSTVRWVRTAYSTNPSRWWEKIAVTLSSDGNLDAYNWNGTAWSLTSDIASVGTDAGRFRSFDLAYEKTAGRAVLAYSSGGGSADIQFRIWNGTSWLGPYALDFTASPLGTVINWVSMAAKPLTGSDEIALIAIDGTNSDVYGAIWNGTAWTSQQQLDTIVSLTTEEVIAIGYEQLSGNAMFVWGVTTDNNAIKSRQWNGTAWDTDATSINGTNGSGNPNWIVLAADPVSDRLMLSVLDGSSDLNTASWDGSAWTVHPVHDTSVNTHANRAASVVWEPSGSKALLVWATDTTNLSYKTWTPSGGWTGTSSFNYDGADGRWVQTRRDPRNVGSAKILVATSDINLDLFVVRWNGTHLVTGVTATTSLSTNSYEGFDISFQVVDEPAPVRDVAITSVGVSPVTVLRPPDVDVTITAIAANQGNRPETSTVTASAGSTTVASQTVNLPVGGFQTLTFVFSTSLLMDGDHLIRVQASIVTGETDTADNSLDDGTLVVSTAPIHDVAVTDVSASPLSVTRPPDVTVTITVNVANQGNRQETFTVTAFAGSATVGTQTVNNLVAGGTQTLTFTLSTSSLADGSYLIRATASTVNGETDTADNSLDDGTLVVSTTPIHDVAVTAVSASQLNVIRPPDATVTITVDVANQGNQPETFTVTAFAGGVTVGTQTVSGLAAGGTQTLTFTFSTSSLADGSYLIRATASIVSGETDTADNSLDDGTLVVTTVVHDVAVTAVSASPLSVTRPPDVTVMITLDVANQGNQPETFTVTAFMGGVTVGTQTVANLAPGGTQRLTFSTTTSGLADGSYLIRATASTVAGETDTAGNSLDDGTVVVSTVIVHDLAVSDVSSSTTNANVGDIVTITVTVVNQGTVDETITVRATYDLNQIGAASGPVAKGSSTRFSIAWNTADVAAGSYSITGSVDPVAGETDTADNELMGGTVTIFGPATLVVQPSAVVDTSLLLGSTFTVAIEVREIANLYGWQTTLHYDTTVLSVTSQSDLVPGSFWRAECTFRTLGFDDASGTISAAITLLSIAGCPTGFSGSTVLIGVNFTVDASGYSTLRLGSSGSETILADSRGSQIRFDPSNGFFSNVELASLTARKAWPESNHYVIAKDPDGNNTLFGKAINLVGVQIYVKVRFLITSDILGLLPPVETDPILLDPFATAILQQGFAPPITGGYRVQAVVLFSPDGVSYFEATSVKTFRFTAV